MKKALVLIASAVILVTSHIYAQDASERFSHRTGVGVPFIPLIIGDFKGYTPALNISYKAGKNKNFIRSGVSTSIKSPLSIYVLNLGYERRFLNGNFQLLAGVDAGLRYYQRKYSNPPYSYKYIEYNYGAGPVLGISYKPFIKFPLSLNGECL